MKNLLAAFNSQYNITTLEKQSSLSSALDNVNPDIIFTSEIPKLLLSWKKRNFAQIIAVYNSLEEIPPHFKADDFLILNQSDTAIRLALILSHQQELFNLKNQLKQKDNFLSVATHDLKTPLTSILGFIELLQEERVCGPLNEKQAKFASQIMDSANHLFRMIKDLLNYSVIESGKMQLNIKKQKLNDILYQIYPEIAVLIKNKEINYITLITDDIYGWFDSERLRQVLENLISNAVKFTSRQGMIQISALRSKKSLKITIKDTGTGIAPEDIKKILDRNTLFTTPGIHGEKGTGLGISICTNILQAHKGNITFDSLPGEGTTVTLIFPDHSVPSTTPRSPT